jgi:hypothetical protein
MVEQWTFNPLVLGSRPRGRTRSEHQIRSRRWQVPSSRSTRWSKGGVGGGWDSRPDGGLGSETEDEMGGEITAGTHTVADVVGGNIADSESRLSPGTINFYRVGQRLLPTAFLGRDVATLRPVQVDALSNELRAGGASEQKVTECIACSPLRSVAPCATLDDAESMLGGDETQGALEGNCASVARGGAANNPRRSLGQSRPVDVPSRRGRHRHASKRALRLRWSDIGEGTITVGDQLLKAMTGCCISARPRPARVDGARRPWTARRWRP